MDIDYQVLRKKMVDEQMIKRGISNERVLDAFYKVERHKFVPEESRGSAYADFPLPIGDGQTISQPYIVALMTESLDLSGNETILEIGTGSGYQTAILAELSSRVYSIERFASLAKKAQDTLDQSGYSNIRIKVDDGSLGWPQEGPFDRIIITAASERVPLPLSEQLVDGGKLILPLGAGSGQILTLLEKKNAKLESHRICGCVFVPLVGKYGYAQ